MKVSYLRTSLLGTLMAGALAPALSVHAQSSDGSEFVRHLRHKAAKTAYKP